MMVIAGQSTRASDDDDGGGCCSRRVFVESDGRAKEGSGGGTAPMTDELVKKRSSAGRSGRSGRFGC